MERMEYETPNMEIILLEQADVICISGDEGDNPVEWENLDGDF